ncbi:MAG: hypothetical protein WCO09_04375 [bacterium]
MKRRDIILICICAIVLAATVGYNHYVDRQLKQVLKEMAILAWERKDQSEDLLNEKMKKFEETKNALVKKVGTEINNLVTIEPEYRPETVEEAFLNYPYGRRSDAELQSIDKKICVSIQQMQLTLNLLGDEKRSSVSDYNNLLESKTCEESTNANELAITQVDEMMAPCDKTASEIINLTWDKIPKDRREEHERNWAAINSRW